MLKSSKRQVIGVSALLFCALSACGGGSAESVPVSVVMPPAVAPISTPPPQTVGDIQFTVDNSISESRDFPRDGGVLELDVNGGARFSLTVPRGAFFADSTVITMQPIVDTQGLPAGLTPIAAVSLSPGGADFAVQTLVEIDLRGLSRPVGNIVVFLANDDGTGLTYLLPHAGDPVAAALSDGPYRVLVPHFSGVGIAVSDPNGPGIQDRDDTEDAEQLARLVINQLVEDRARDVMMGLRLIGEPLDGIESAIDEWLNDLRRRANALGGDSPLRDFAGIANEILRFEETRRTLAIADAIPTLEETEVGAILIEKLANQVNVWNDRCVAGNADAIHRIEDRITFLRNLTLADLLKESTFNAIDQPNFCLPT